MRKLLMFALCVMFGMALFLGCGDDKSEVTVSSTQKDAAKGMVTGVSGLKGIKSNPNDQVALANLNGIYSNAQVLTAAVAASQSALTRALTTDTTTECATISGDTITYKDCNYGSAGAAFSINGTITVSSNSVKVDLTMSLDYSGATGTTGGTSSMKMNIVYKGDMTITDTTLSGSLSVSMTYDVSGTGVPAGAGSGTGTTDITYNDITLTSGCPTAGSMDVKTSASAGGSSAAVDLTVEFGPACGDAKVYTNG